MNAGTQITQIHLDALRITPKTVWLFLRLEAEDGLVGTGEATLAKTPEAVLAAAGQAAPRLLGSPADPQAAAGLPWSTLPEAAFRSAADMALHDIAAQRSGEALAESLGPVLRERIPVYANINRRTAPRTPEAFAESARLALVAGHRAIKLAPFDEVTPEVCAEKGFAARLEQGIARIAATREAIGPDVPLRVDCHWRFDRAGAERLIDAVAPLALDWVECPIPEEPGSAAALAELRARANARGTRLAGLETGIGLEAFRPFLERGAYDVIMPDVKYLGGLGLFAPLEDLARRHGAEVSPHNPTGPICHAASLAVAARCTAFDSLEMQFDESPLFDALVGGPVSAIQHGEAARPPSRSGLGVTLDEEVVATQRIAGLSRVWTRPASA